MDTSDIPGVDPSAVKDWLRRELPWFGPVEEIRRLAGGRSNISVRIDDVEGRSIVLRRPPVGPIQPSAHDVVREHRILSILGGRKGIPTPRVHGSEDDPAPIGAPFYIMEYVPGTIVRHHGDVQDLDVDARREIGTSLVKVLARFHNLDIAEPSLSGYGRADGYLGRQLELFNRQLESDQTRDLPLARSLGKRLVRAIPEQQRGALVHGDFRLDNVILTRDLDIRAVLDWELSTLGDPLADFAVLLAYWTEPGDPVIPGLSSPTDLDGFLDRESLCKVYAEHTGLDLEPLPYYQAFALWRMAIILDGVYCRYVGGAYAGDSASRYEPLADAVFDLLDRSSALLR